MNLVTHKKFKGDRLMPWGKATVVTGAKGYVFLSGNTATAEDYDPLNQKGGTVGDAVTEQHAHRRTDARLRRARLAHVSSIGKG